MRYSFIDDLLFIVPLHRPPGRRLFGEAVGAHEVPLTLALESCRDQYEEMTVDLTGVHYLGPGALEALVSVARTLRPPQCLTLRAKPELALHERLVASGCDTMATLQLCPA